MKKFLFIDTPPAPLSCTQAITQRGAPSRGVAVHVSLCAKDFCAQGRRRFSIAFGKPMATEGGCVLFIFFFLFFNCASFIMHSAFAQNPLVKQWDYRFGGTGDDWLTGFQQTRDGGYILGGSSYCGISGDKTQPSWGIGDYWIVKIDAFGNKQWDKRFGGTGDDELTSIQQTTDGGYILGGASGSGISGDRTQTSWGIDDYWIIKIDSLGNKQWDKDFGGTSNDELRSLQQSTDGGYILGGYSSSGIGGDKTQSCWGVDDFWVVKTDSLGNKQWDKDFGGADYDELHDLQQTTDGGFLLGGLSRSGISGNKTQNTWGGGGIDIDFWIVKIDSLGNKQWDKDFGGTFDDWLLSLKQTNDKGYILGGASNSAINGDKTQASWGLYDYWIIKIDSLGNKQWDKDFGGTNREDEFGNISQTNDGGYLIACTSYSNISGNKSENNLGDEQAWIIKTDSVGNKQWDKTVFTPCHEETVYASQQKDGCFAIATWAYFACGTGGEKTQASWNNSDDYWIIKFCEGLTTYFSTPINDLCPGTCTDFLNLSFNAISYQWFFPGASPDTSTATNPTNICYTNSGSYDVQLIATNANGSDTLLLSNYITVYPAPAPQAIAQSGDTLFANAGAATYQWYYNSALISGATNYFYVAPSSGDYNVVCTDSNGCEVEAAVFNVIAASPTQPPQRGGVEIHPNPAHDELYVTGYSLSGDKAELEIYNSLGEKVYSQHLLSANCLLPTAGWSSGIYLVKISAAEKIITKKIIKE